MKETRKKFSGQEYILVGQTMMNYAGNSIINKEWKNELSIVRWIRTIDCKGQDDCHPIIKNLKHPQINDQGKYIVNKI